MMSVKGISESYQKAEFQKNWEECRDVIILIMVEDAVFARVYFCVVVSYLHSCVHRKQLVIV